MSQGETTVDITADPAVMRDMRRRAILSCLVGNFLELYDFTLYGFFAIFLGQTFFPSKDPMISLLGSLATFGVGFVMRPVGGLVMGAYADRFGRKGALILTMAMMAIATGLPGLLPGYASDRRLGAHPPGAVPAGAGILDRRRMGRRHHLHGGIRHAGPPRLLRELDAGGVALGSLCGAGSAWFLTTSLDAASLQSWGWRIPFVIGFLLLPIGYYLRRRVAETPVFERLAAARKVAGRRCATPSTNQNADDGAGLRHLHHLECRRLRAAGLSALVRLAGAEGGPEAGAGCAPRSGPWCGRC